MEWKRRQYSEIAAIAEAIVFQTAHGEACFAARLTDYEYAVNHHNWRQAGRLNNPFAESLNLDPDGRFIRRHLPELAHLPTSALHAPHLAGSDVETNGYPPPCVQV